MAIVQSVEIPRALVDAYQEKIKDGKPISTGLFTPESTPEPPQLPQANNNTKTRAKRISALIKSIDDSPGDNPFVILGVRTTEEFQSRVPALKEALNKETSEEAKNALQKVEQAEVSVAQTVAASKAAIKRALENPDAGLVELLEARDDDDREAKTAVWKWLLDPGWNKEPEAEKAMQVLLSNIKSYGENDDESMKDDSEDEEEPPTPETDKPRSKPGATTLALYDKATPFMTKILESPGKSHDAEVKALSSLNDSISDQNMKIRVGDIIKLADDCGPWLEKLRSNPSDKEAESFCETTNIKLMALNSKYYYPGTWILDLSHDSRGASTSFLSELMGSKSVSTKIGVSVTPGSTLDGGKILRHIEYFAQKPKKKGEEVMQEVKQETKQPRYSFLVWNDGEYSMKTGKEIGQSAIDGYFKDGKENKLKMGTYYGKIKHGIEYSRAYFTDLLAQTKETGEEHLLFLGAVRKTPRTKTGRTMPPEHCIIGIRDPNINAEWYEVFTRSAWTKFYGDEAGHRFDEYWKERGQKPSYRVGLVDDGPGASQETGSMSSTTENAALRKEIDQIRKEVKEIKSSKDDMENRIMAEMQKMTADIMAQMNEMMTKMSVMVKKD